jgi:hypothetical protein
MAVVNSRKIPALNAILASSGVNLTLLKGLNRYIKNKLTYIFV